MSSSELEDLYEQLKTCITEVQAVYRELENLEERKANLPLEEYLSRFDQIVKKAQHLNDEKQLIGQKIQELNLDNIT